LDFPIQTGQPSPAVKTSVGASNKTSGSAAGVSHFIGFVAITTRLGAIRLNA